MSATGLRLAQEKMSAAGVSQEAIDVFTHYYAQLEAGVSGYIAEDSIDPLTDPDLLSDVEVSPDEAQSALGSTVMIKLNGGLGTSMGMDRAKSLLEVKDGLSFLDITARQVLGLRRRHGARLPLVLMDSFSTREDSLAALRRHEGLEADLPLDFLQNKEPKLLAEDLTPASWPQDPRLEWAPPGHGDLYTALVTSGTLARMREQGYDYAFVSNSDNLGAVLDPRILAWFAREGLPFAMEVCDRTEADRKGGHLARRPGAGLVLREIAQTPDEDFEAFMDIGRDGDFYTNNLLVDLRAVDDVLR